MKNQFSPKTWLLLLALILAGTSKAQLTGTIAVPSGTYANLAAVVTALNTQGVGTGGVIINLTAGNPQTAPTGGYVLGSSVLNASLSSTKTITINGNANTVTSYTGTGTADGIFYVAGADYVTVNGLNLTEAAANTTSTTQMEFGYALVKLNNASPFDGCRNITIKNCTIALNATNSASSGILMGHVVATASATTLSSTGAVASDANANIIFTGNNISNCNYGIKQVGISSSMLDSGITIGGNTAALGNIFVVGGSTNTCYAVNTLNDANLLILNNSFSISATQNAANYFLNTQLGRGDLNISNNTFDVTATATAATYVLYNYNSSSNGHSDPLAIYTYSNNTLTGTNTSSTGYLYGMYNYYSNFAVENITNNNFTNLTWGTSTSTGYIYLTYNYYTTTPKINFTGNNVSNILKNGSTTGGYLYCYYNYSYPATATDTVTFTNNKINNVVTNYYTYGLAGAYGSTTQVLINKYNKLSNLTINGTSGYLYAMYNYYGVAGSEVAYDTIIGVKAYGMYGIYGGHTLGNYHNIYMADDTVMGGTFYCFYNANGTPSFYNNTITGITQGTTSGTIYGIYTSTVTGSANIYNNFIGNFRLAGAYSGTGLYGMYLSATAGYNVYHNTIRLSGITTTGANLGVAGIYYSSGISSLDLRNNIINVNTTPTGTGIAVAVVRSAGTAGVVPTNFAATSNSNIYYTPNVTNSYLYAEGYSTSAVNKFNLTNDVNFNTGCGLFKAFMAPAESSSFTENNLNQVGSSALYTPSGASYAKSLGVATTAPAVTTDLNGTTRATPPDAGAFQFTGTGIDAAAPIISYAPLATTTYCTNAIPLAAVITDVSGVNTTAGTAPRIYYKKSSDADAFGVANTNTGNGWKWVEATGTAPNFSFAIDYSKLQSAVTVGDSITYFVDAQDNATTPNIGLNTIGLTTCPTSVNLLVANGPTLANPKANGYRIIASPALPTITPPSATICQGGYVSLTANPPAIPSVATIGTGSVQNSTTSYPTPYGQYYGSDHEQYLITAAELSAMGIGAGNITSLAFNLASGYTYAALQNFMVQVAPTTDPALTATFISTGFTTVYSNTSFTPPATAGWASITFSTPFVWNGTSNIVIDVSFSNCSVCNGTSTCTTSYTNNGVVNQSNTSYVATHAVYYDGNCTVNSFNPTGTFLNYTYSQRPNMQLSYTKTFPVNWTPVTGLYKNTGLTQAMAANDTNKVVYASPATTTTYTVSTVLGGCLSAASNSVTVTVNPAPTATIAAAGPVSFCQGGSVVLNGNTGTGLTYQWSLNGSPISGATSSSYTANASGSYTLAVTSPACALTVNSAATTVTVNPLPTATITAAGPTTFCQGNSVILNANTGTGLTYQWKQGGNPITGATNGAYTATTTGSYTVVVTSGAGCSTTSAVTAITVNPAPTSTITAVGPTTFCQGDSVILNGNTITGATYQWQLAGNPITGATNTAYTAMTAGSYTLIVTNGCSTTSSPTSVTVNALPTATATATGNTTFCQGGTVTLNANSGTGLTYQWKRNGTNLGGATSNTYSANQTGTYTVVVTSTAGCTKTSNSINITVNPLPTANVTALGSLTVCQGDNVVLTANTGTNYTYQWKLNGGNITGANGSSYSATTAGSYTVTITSLGCSTTSSAVTVNVTALPPASVTPTGAVIICEGSNIMLGANIGVGYSYQWLYNGVPINGAIYSVYQAATAGNYTVVITLGSCSGISTATVITTAPPPLPIVVLNGPVLSVTLPFISYQWYLNGNAISGATSQTYTTTQSGVYNVIVTDGSGCPGTSAFTVINSLGISGISWAKDIQIYPNPATTAVHIIAPQKVNITVNSIEGRTLISENNAKDIDVSNLANGVYLIRITDENGTLVKVERLVKNQ